MDAQTDGNKMTKLQELRAKRAELVKELHGLADAGDEAAFDKLDGEIRAIDGRIARQERLDALVLAEPAVPLRRGSDGAFEDRARRDFSLRRALAAAAGLSSEDAGLEREIMAETRQRSGRSFEGLSVPLEALQTRVMTGASVGSLIGTDHLAAQYIDRLRASLITGRLGATVLSGLIGDVEIPKNTSSDTHYWIGDNAAITAADKSMSSVTLSPKHCGMLTEYSRKLLLQSSPDVEMLLRNDFSAELAIAIDHAALAGGAPNEPTGIINMVGVPVTGSSVINWSNVISAIMSVESANAVVSGWAGSAQAKRTAMTTPKQASGVEGSFIMTDPNILAGYPFYQSQILRDAGSPELETLIVGQWSDLLIGYWSGIDILVNPYESTAYSKGNVQIRAIVDVDIDVRHIESFCVIS